MVNDIPGSDCHTWNIQLGVLLFVLHIYYCIYGCGTTLNPYNLFWHEFDTFDAGRRGNWEARVERLGFGYPLYGRAGLNGIGQGLNGLHTDIYMISTMYRVGLGWSCGVRRRRSGSSGSPRSLVAKRGIAKDF